VDIETNSCKTLKDTTLVDLRACPLQNLKSSTGGEFERLRRGRRVEQDGAETIIPESSVAGNVYL
jgi:hypothetical protein